MYPITYEADFKPEPNRWSTFFRLILAIPWLIVAYAINYIHLGAAVVAWLTIVFRGYLPEGINSTLTFVNSFYTRVYGYFALLTDDYPPIGIERAKPSAPPPPAAPAA